MMLQRLSPFKLRPQKIGNFVQLSARSIGFLDIDEKDYINRDLGPKPYDPMRRPQLFTELDPAGLEDDGDEIS